MSTEWGPWITHDGKGCPCVGQYVHFFELLSTGGVESDFVIAGARGGKSWDWSNAPEYTRIIRYRIRKPLGMAILQAIVKSPERELETT